MSNCKIHNVRFYKPKAKAIYCMSFNKKTQKLALSRYVYYAINKIEQYHYSNLQFCVFFFRSDASIEIWNLKDSPVMEKYLPSSIKNFSIEGLAWSGHRLFTVGLHALLCEYDLKQLSIKSQTSVTGQTAFCLDVNRQETRIAVGTEQGYLNIFSIVEDELVFEKFLDKQEGRILCLKYDHTGEFIASGSMDTIRVWNVKTGHAIHKMTTGRSAANKATIVWCIAVTKNMTIITGDSRGKLSFWDGTVGAQTESYQSHKADVLTLCLTDDDNEVHCAGIDANIITYRNIAVRGDLHKWVKSVQRKVHDHDVRALVMNKKYLYSGGVDGYLACSYYPPKTLLKYPPVSSHPNNCAEIASKARYILLKYPKSVELWSMGEEAEQEKKVKFGAMLPIKKKPVKLLVLQRQVKTDIGVKREGILSSTINSTGKYIAFSTMSALRLFRFDYMNNKPTLTQCELPFDNPCINMMFSPEGNQLIVAPQEGGLEVLNILNNQATRAQTIPTDKCKWNSLSCQQFLFFTYFSDIHDTITFLRFSPCGQYLIATDPESNIAVWKRTSSNYKPWEFYFKLPRHSCSPTAISVQANSMNLLIAYADHKVSKNIIKAFTSEILNYFYFRYPSLTWRLVNLPNFRPKYRTKIINCLRKTLQFVTFYIAHQMTQFCYMMIVIFK